MRLGKKGKAELSIFHIALILLAIQVLGIYDFGQLIGGGSGAEPPADSGGAGDVMLLCPTDGDTTLKVDVRNELQTTTTEEFDVTAYIYDSTGALVATLTDTTDPTGTNINCGDTYVGKVVVSDSDGGDNSKIVGKDYGDVTINSDGSFSFSTVRSTLAIGLRGRQHGLLQFKMYDNDLAAFAYDTGDATNAEYETDGVIYQSTGQTTAKDIDSGGLLDITINVQGTATDTDFQDHYVLVAIEGGTSALTVWNDPNSVTWNGVEIPEVSTSLTPEENKLLNSYEWVYRIDGPIEDNVNQLRIQMTPASGQDPDADMEFDFHSAGGYLSTDGRTVKIGAADDTTSYAAVFTVQDITLNITAD